MSWKIYHNPRCSKSRQTLQLLKDHNVEPEVVEYLSEPPSESDIKMMIRALGAPELLVRTKEDEFRQKPFDTSDEKAVIQGLRNAPRLMERPVVVFGEKVVLGRPPENVLALLKPS